MIQSDHLRVLAALSMGLIGCSSADSKSPGAVEDGVAMEDAETSEDTPPPEDTDHQDGWASDSTGPSEDTETLQDAAPLQDVDEPDSLAPTDSATAPPLDAESDGEAPLDVSDQDAVSTSPDADVEAPADVSLLCFPDEVMCDNGDVYTCSPDGQVWALTQECLDGTWCAAGACVTACDVNVVQPSNEGCLFTAVTTTNPDLGDLFIDGFAVVLANRADNPPASVTVTQGDALIFQGEVAPGDTKSISLVMVSALVDEDTASVLAPEAAYEIATDVPVTAAQFSPLQFQMGDDFTMSNDASLLLPHHALTQSYTAVGFPAWAYWVAWRTGFVAVAATADDTQVTVTASSPIAAGALLPEMAPGDTQTVTLHRGDVLQLLGWAPEAGVDNQITPETCDGPGWQFAEQGLGNACEATDLDLTGTRITSTAPVAVFAGHSCLRVPFDAHACDHVEEQLFPDAAWGQEAVLTAPERPDGAGPAVATYRVVARDDDTTVNLSPPVAGPFSLAAGEQAGFTTDQDVRVAATGPILAVMALHGAQGLDPPAMDGNLPLSDPSIGLIVPLRQARDEYVFLTPSTFQSDWLNVVAFQGSDVLLDGVSIAGWTNIGTTPYAVARVPVAPGNHHAVSADGQSFTLMSYGHANHTSYLYPGGLNLDP